MKRIIITGAGGFIGCELTKKLIRKGYEVHAISLLFNPAFPEDPNVKKYCSGLSDAQSILDLLPEGEYEAFYHLAWRGVNGPEKADPQIQLDNIKLTLACAEASKKLGCKKFLCAGTIAERAIESLPKLEKTGGGMLYGTAKYCAHQMLETYCKNVGIDFVWMQFSNIYGPQNKTGNLVSYTLGEISQGREATFGPALQPYDFIYVEDLIEAVFRLGTMPTSKNRYYIGSGSPRILMEYLLQIGQEYGRPELIRIGVRPDDGIVYTLDMFDIQDLVRDIGDYNSTDFDSGIRLTIQGY